ncbi:MAG: pyridoxal phosphate-dependent aminotransferase [Proteobacteria bacterium]|nr:pyridoxal phosphate-dependent aminotransferase [Pseudomonadota bacterium]
MSFISERVKQIKPSATLAITAKAKAMKASGIDIVSFGAGEPDFDTPDNIKEAAHNAIRSGFTKYTAVGGTDELKEAIAARMKEDCHVEYALNNIIASCGGKHSLYNIFQAIINPGDEVIIPSPYWVSYPDMVLLAGGKPVIVDCHEETGFKMQPHQLSSLITEKTKAIVINSPSNPTGAAYTEDDLKALAEIAVNNNLLVISDEIYNRISYNNFKVVSMASLGEEIRKLTLVVNGVSKTYSMTGWRIGYVAGDEEIVKAMNKIQAQSTSNPTSISQAAAIEALIGPQAPAEEMVSHFEKRKDYIVQELNAINGVTCFDPQGAFYAFPNVSSYFGKSHGGDEIKNSADMTRYLLEEAKVAVVPGGEFGAEGYIRLSYATSMENIEKGLKRIKEALASL